MDVTWAATSTLTSEFTASPISRWTVPWTLFYELEPLTVEYDGGIALRGLALGQGAEQMSSRQVLKLGRDRPLWMALQWQIAPGLEVDYSISLRLYGVEGR